MPSDHFSLTDNSQGFLASMIHLEHFFTFRCFLGTFFHHCVLIKCIKLINELQLSVSIEHTWSPLAYKWANNSPLIKSLALLTTRNMIAFGTKSLVVFVTIRIYESTKFLIVSTWRSNCGSSELACGSPWSWKLMLFF